MTLSLFNNIALNFLFSSLNNLQFIRKGLMKYFFLQNVIKVAISEK